MFKKIMISKKKISIIGLGYVGLPLAAEFAKKYKLKIKLLFGSTKL